MGHIALGALIGGAINLGIKASRGQIGSFKDGLVAFGIGAAAGAVTGGMALGAFPGLTAASITGGSLAGVTGAATGGLVQGIGNSIYFNDPYTVKDWATGVVIGGVKGGIGGGILAKIKGKNLWWGTDIGKDRTNWSWNNSPRGVKGTIEFGEKDFLGVDKISNIQQVLNGADEVTQYSTSFAGQTGNQMLLPPPNSYSLHHVFPQQFRNWFLQRGISNIDDYTKQISTTTHIKGIHGKGLVNLPGKWNSNWNEFINANPNANPSEIFHFGEGLLKRYGLEHLPYIIYKK